MKRFISSIFCLLFIAHTAAAEKWCYEKNLNYPNGMFGQFSHKTKVTSQKINSIFKFGKDSLSEHPERMLYGLAYLEVLMNELCFDRHNTSAIQSREKIQKVIINLRTSLGLPSDMSRQKMINIYWSTGKLLEMASVKKLEIDKTRMDNIKILREAKSLLKSELSGAMDEK